jgi:hypothetical protein
MDAHDRLSHTWRELTRRHGCATARAEVVLAELLRAYSEPPRKYHTIEHIGSLLRQLEEHGHAVVDRDAVVLAMLFHDVFYDPLRLEGERTYKRIASPNRNGGNHDAHIFQGRHRRTRAERRYRIACSLCLGRSQGGRGCGNVVMGPGAR